MQEDATSKKFPCFWQSICYGKMHEIEHINNNNNHQNAYGSVR